MHSTVDTKAFLRVRNSLSDGSVHEKCQYYFQMSDDDMCPVHVYRLGERGTSRRLVMILELGKAYDQFCKYDDDHYSTAEFSLLIYRVLQGFIRR